MRVRITRPLAGSIDGIQLSRLEKGQVYDVNTSLACYLLSEKMAEPAIEEKPAGWRRVESRQPVTRPAAETRKATIRPRSIAADRRHSRKHKGRKEP